jgi:hypothetical protein
MSYIKQKADEVPADNLQGTIAPDQVAYGDPDNSGKIKGSDNFTFVDEAGGNGPTVQMTGDKPVLKLQDDTDATTYRTELLQSGASMYVNHKDSTGTNNELLRLAAGTVIVNDEDGDIDFRVAGTSSQSLLRTNAAQNNVGVNTNPASDVESLHIKGTGADDTMVRLESTDTDTDAGPILELYRNKASPVANDLLGRIQWTGEASDGSAYQAGRIESRVVDTTAGSENAKMQFYGRDQGANQLVFEINQAADLVVNPESNSFRDMSVLSNGGTNLFCDSSQDNVGIGTQPDSGVERLHVKGTGLTDMVVFEGTSEGSGSTDGPDLILYNSATPTGPNKFIGRLEFRGKNDGGSAVGYGSIQTFIQDDTASTEDSLMLFKTFTGGSALEKLRLNLGGTEINSTGNDSLGFNVKTGSTTQQQSFFRGYNSSTIGDRYTEVLRGSKDVSSTPVNITGTFCYGSNIVIKSGASVINLPEAIPGMHLQIVNTNISGVTAVPASAETINGSTSAYSIHHGWVIAKLIAYQNGAWVLAEAF